MSPIYLNQPPAISLPGRDRGGDQSHFISPFNRINDHTSSFSSPLLFHSLQDQDHHLHQVQHHLQQGEIINEQYNLISGGLSNCSSPYPRIAGEKMRIMRKMIHSDLAIIQSNSSRSEDQSSPCGMIRFCSNCHTTKTPLWRSGPSGPKSLCNACGIRQRKARRAAAAAAGCGLVPAVHAPTKARKVDFDRTVPFKKRCKFTNAIRTKTTSTRKKKLCSEDHHVKLSVSTAKASSFHQVFPQDERDAATLLMALSDRSCSTIAYMQYID